MSTATPGRIVIYRAASAEQIHNGAETYPAIVTQVFPGSDYANLLCLPPFAPPFHEGSVVEGDGPRTWAWPVKVEQAPAAVEETVAGASADTITGAAGVDTIAGA